MSSVSGSTDGNLSKALDKYAQLLSHPDPHKLKEIAEQTVALDTLAHSVIHAASPAIRTTASDLENLLKSPLSVSNKEVSILTASKHYIENPTTAELGDLVRELCHNELALGLMCKELTLLSSAIKNPNESAS